MKLSKFIEGLNILRPYYDKDSYCIGAEHDQFYAYATSRPLTTEDVEKMRSLDWFQPEQDDGAEYDPDEGWSAFV